MAHGTRERTAPPLSGLPSSSVRVQVAREFTRAGAQMSEQFHDGWQALRRIPRGGGALVLALWVLAIFGDGYTTISMMEQGYVEANPFAAPLMQELGVVAYVVLASLLCAALAVPGSSSWPRLRYARLLWFFSALIAFAKCVVAVQNFHVWHTGDFFFGLL